MTQAHLAMVQGSTTVALLPLPVQLKQLCACLRAVLRAGGLCRAAVLLPQQLQHTNTADTRPHMLLLVEGPMVRCLRIQ